MKQVILMRSDLGMSVGKMCAQAAHAVLAPNEAVVVLSVTNSQLLAVMDKAVFQKLPYRWVYDAGHTEVPKGTLTCGCIGPCEEKVLDKLTGQLKLL